MLATNQEAGANAPPVNGQFAKVPFINRAVLDEGTVFVNQTKPQTTENVTDWRSYLAPGLHSGFNNLAAASRRDHFWTVTKLGVNVQGIQHTSEIAFVSHVLKQFSPDLKFPELYLRLEDTKYWVNFASTLDPNSSPTSPTSYPYWPKYGGNAILTELGANITVIPDTFRTKGNGCITRILNSYNPTPRCAGMAPSCPVRANSGIATFVPRKLNSIL
ncbi:unnamed protein product [Rhizoctonia solani]|uniref:Uncharacterized protein n=1 Tax=Rhizoctonia solani TaxID=456999 RepID=A0A8H3CN87_9AGAM|nr:unnamed protein product [Rhizoctonia solani]